MYCKYSKQNKNSAGGNVLSGLVLAVAVGAIALTSLLTVGGAYTKNQSEAKTSESSGSVNAFNLALISNRFLFQGTNPPIWYPVPYPTAEEMQRVSALKPLPRVEVIQGVTNDTVVQVITEKATGNASNPTALFTPDKTGLGAVRNITSPELQTAHVSSGDMTLISQMEMANFISNPTLSWPKSGSSNLLQAVTNYELSFLEYIPDSLYPDWAKKIRISITSWGVDKKPITTVADISMDPPPSPHCKLKLKTPLTQPLTPGLEIPVILETDSITTLAEISSDNGLPPVNYEIKSDRSVHDFGKFKNITKSEIIVIATGNFLTIRAIVWGVTSQEPPEQCSLVVVPDPLCILSASPSNLAKDKLTLLTLECQNPVASASIDGITVPYDVVSRKATLSYKKKTSIAETVSALATGPTGGTSNPSTILSSGCRFSDPNYKELIATPGWGKVTYGKNIGPKYPPMIPSTTTRGLVQWTYWGNTSYLDYNDSWRPCPANSICTLHDNLHDRIRFDQGHTLEYQWFSAVIGNASSESCALKKVHFRNGGCFASNTTILMGDGTKKVISKIRPGDKVWNPHFKKGMKVRKVVQGPEPIPLFEVSVGLQKVVVTEGHPFYTDRGWLQTSSLQIGDMLLGEGKPMLVSGVKRLALKAGQVVWNMELDAINPEGHIIIANGIPTGDLVIQKQLKKSLLSAFRR